MAIKIADKKYKCLFCDFTSDKPTLVDAHRDSEHDFVLVPMLREDLNKLIMYLYTGEPSLITEKFYTTLQQYARYRPKEIDINDL